MKRSLGLGLVELIVAVAVLGIIAAVAAPSFSDMLNRRRVQAVATSISTDIAYFRAEQSLRNQELDLLVNLDPVGHATSCYAIGILQNSRTCKACWNADDAAVCTGFGPAALPVKVERLPTNTNVSFAANTDTLKFELPQLTPKPSDFFFDVCGASKINPRPVLRVELNAVGRAKVCSPNSSMSGYGTCTNGSALQCPAS